MLRVGILYGGRSGEHDVSLCSAASVLTALDPEKYEVVPIGINRSGRWFVQESARIVDHRDFGTILTIEERGDWYLNHYENENRLHLFDRETGNTVSVDVVFPVIHGTFCEDGTVQGLMELAMVPYVGADVTGSAVAMDKDIAKRLLRESGVPVVPWITVTRREWEEDQAGVMDEALKRLGIPLFVKPAGTGSSVGVGLVRDAGALGGAVDSAFRYDNKVLLEKSVSAREIECAVLGNDDPAASIPGEVRPNHEFYSYESKYIDPNGAELIIPAELDPALAGEIRRQAVRAYRALACTGMARVDFFLDRESGDIYCNEINTLPGFTGISMYPKLWENTGLTYRELLDRLIELAIERHTMKKRITTDY